MNQYAPGMRLLIRDEEWLVKRVDNNSFEDSYTLSVVGLSRLVKDREAIFISSLEEITAINPAETDLVIDDSASFIKSRLYMESLLRRKAPTDNKLYIGHKAAMNTLSYQLDPSIISLDKPRQRILIADAVGLGKTLEAGILMSELIYRGKGKRILVVTVKSMMTQFQKEMWNRFSIPLVRLDSQGVQKIRSKIPSNHNPFYYYDKTIVSIDTLKRDVEYRNYIENSWWDIIVIDEAHNVAERGSHMAQRAKLAKLLAKRSDTLIMLSATPHDGKPESFASLMNMLDPTAIANPSDYKKEDIKGLFVRRFKKDIKSDTGNSFKERKIEKERCIASSKEEEIFDYFAKINFKTIDGGRHSSQLFKTTLEKSLFSSPIACIKTLDNRIKKLEKEDSITQEIEHDLAILKNLKSMLEDITTEDFSRYSKLVNIIKSKEYAWTKNTDDRIVIFTERIETLKYLFENLKSDLKLKDGSIAIMHGAMSDIELQQIVDDFGREESKLRILVASDVASEGINLHYLSHRLVHFDIPWSLMAFQQRNGRIDRYGQENEPDIRYLVTDTNCEGIKGDFRILEILIDKEDKAIKNIGDPSVLMKTYNEEEQEKITQNAIENKTSPEEFEEMLSVENTENNDDFDILSMIDNFETSDIESEDIYGENKTLFNDMDYMEDSLRYFTEKEKIKYEKLNQKQQINIDLTDDMKNRLKELMPAEAMPKDDILRLSPDKELIQNEIVSSRQEKLEENTWPKIQYLWDMHPIVDWVNDKSSIIFGRQEAPVMQLNSGLEKGEKIFIVSGLIPNRKSHPLVNEWFGVIFKDNTFKEIISMDEVLKKTHINDKVYPNRNNDSEKIIEGLKELLPNVIDKSKDYMQKKLKEFENIIDPKLEDELIGLEKLRQKHYDHKLDNLENVDKNKDSLATRKQERTKREIDEIFDGFIEWVEDTMTLEKNPYIQLVAVITEVE